MESLLNDAELYYVDDFLSKEEADNLFEILNDDNKFKYYNIYFYDHDTKKIKITQNHRLSYWLGEYSQAVQTCDKYFIDSETGEKISIPTDFVMPYSFPNEIVLLKERIEKQYNVSFNSCLVGKFTSPDDKIGYHSDASLNMGDDPHIASVSFGKSRQFKIRMNKKFNKNKQNTLTKIDMILNHGSLLVMRDNVNRKYLHSVPSDPECSVNNCRINITFRNYNYHDDEKKIICMPF